MPPQYGLQQLALVVSLSIPPALCTLWEDLLSLVDKTFLMQNLLFLVPVSKGEEREVRVEGLPTYYLDEENLLAIFLQLAAAMG